MLMRPTSEQALLNIVRKIYEMNEILYRGATFMKWTSSYLGNEHSEVLKFFSLAICTKLN